MGLTVALRRDLWEKHGFFFFFLLKIVKSGSSVSQDSLADILSLGRQSSVHSFNPEWLFGVL